MADIFISYSKGSQAQTQQLADELRAKGFTVWYDTSLLPGDSFRDVIMSELAQARAAIVIWTADSVKSDWVCSEASRARARRVLIPVRADDVRSHDIPPPFDSLHTELLSNRSAIEAALAKLGITPTVAMKNEPATETRALLDDATRLPLTLRNKPSIAGATPAATAHQEIHFCSTVDGVQLAYARMGQGSPLVKAGAFLTHLEKELESPIWRHFWRDLARDYTVIRYDARGNGLSDWDVEELSFDAFVQDLETVVDAVGLNRFPLLGISQGCAVSIAYAVRHPERVTRLVLYGGFAQGAAKRARSAAEREQLAAVQTLVRLGWGQENPAFRQIFTSQFVPEGTKEQIDWWNEMQRVSASPENAARFMAAVGDIDVTDLLAKVAVPTLVMHARDEARVPFEAGRRMAAGIPGARLVPLQSRNHLILESEPAYARFLEEIRSFLRA